MYGFVGGDLPDMIDRLEYEFEKLEPHKPPVDPHPVLLRACRPEDCKKCFFRPDSDSDGCLFDRL